MRAVGFESAFRSSSPRFADTCTASRRKIRHPAADGAISADLARLAVTGNSQLSFLPILRNEGAPLFLVGGDGQERIRASDGAAGNVPVVGVGIQTRGVESF